MNNTNGTETIRTRVMESRRAGKAHMRPRRYFVLMSALALTGIGIVLLALLYITSLAVYMMRESGVWFAPAFGVRGWFEFARSIPVLLLVLVALFTIVLELLVRRYAFVYRKPLLISLAGIALIVMAGGFIVAQTSLHRRLAHGHTLPLIDQWYHPPLRIKRPRDVYRGAILELTSHGFVIADEEKDGTSTIVEITPRTRLPYGEDFKVGDLMLIVGDTVATNTIEAFGIRELDQSIAD